MARVKSKVTGYRQVEKALLDSFGAGRREAVKEFNKLAGDIADDAASLAPVDEGTLSENIIFRKAYDDAAGFVFVIGPEYPVAAHGHLVEFGTDPHTITSDTGLASDTEFFGKRVDHPGSPAQPFLRPAIDAAERPIVETAKKSFIKGMKLS